MTKNLVTYTDQHRIVRVVNSEMLRWAGLKRHEMLTGANVSREISSKAARCTSITVEEVGG